MMPTRLKENDLMDEEDDDDKMSEFSVIRYAPGTRVVITAGRYEGEKGTVQNETRTLTDREEDRNYWVHLDYDREDLKSAIVFRPEHLRRLIEEDEESEESKEVGQGYPRFGITRAGSANNVTIYHVFVDTDFIGSLHHFHDAWYVAFVAHRELHTHFPVSSPEKGAETIWKDQIGVIQLPEMEIPRDPLVPPPDDPDHYESQEWDPVKLVSALAEDDTEDNTAPVEKPVKLLHEAGFTVISKSPKTVKFTWPSESKAHYLNGVRRAREILEDYQLTSGKCKNGIAELTATLSK